MCLSDYFENYSKLVYNSLTLHQHKNRLNNVLNNLKKILIVTFCSQETFCKPLHVTQVENSCLGLYN